MDSDESNGELDRTECASDNAGGARLMKEDMGEKTG
jgi:hypothetical protein